MSASNEMAIMNYKAGAYIYVEDDAKADFIYIIRSGNVRLRKDLGVSEDATLSAGDFFGMVSCMSGHAQIETAQAMTDVNLIAVLKVQFPLLIKKYPSIAMKMIKQFSQKMRTLDESLTQITLNADSNTESFEHLFQVAEFYVKENKFNLAYHAYFRYLQYHKGGVNAAIAQDRLNKITPHIQGVHVDNEENQFNRVYQADTMVFSESEPGDEMYIIQSGNIKITKIIDNKEVLLAVLKPSDIFGEMALLDNKPRSASAIASKEAKLMVINRNNFEKITQTQPQLIDRLMTLLSGRIWGVYKQLENAHMKNPVGKLWDALLLELEKARVPITRTAHTYDISMQELANMVGLTKSEGSKASRELLDATSCLKLEDNHIVCKDLTEIEKQAKYYRKMQLIQDRRATNSQN